ncbi:cobalamin biosynthesis protein CobD/CbiB [Thalassotalea sediminis]|uniref:cobalamin biosynthesis protein CobD/CbiB n=1 Tax=Thalassotalea sediminis TaxID=1759089 RepID=UPI002573E037|nr:cobalamin biosynthesis protein [Thalassotalea sediminis]
MTDFIDQLTPFTWQLVIVLLVIILKSVIDRFQSYQSRHFFQFYCQRLSDKVNNEDNGKQQQMIAGAVATIITVLPIAIILWLFENFIEVPLLWHSLLLYFALSGFGAQRTAEKLIAALQKQDKHEAKSIIQPRLFRDVSRMSPLGLNKACIEMLWLNHLHRQFTVIFYFIAFGPLAAFLYRLMLEMHFSWNIKAKQFQYFGQFIARIMQILQWVPCLLLTLEFKLTMIGRKNSSSAPTSYLFSLNSNYLLATAAHINNIQLGGVAMYQDNKLRRLAFNANGRQPDTENVSNTLKQLNLIQTLNIGMLICLLILFTFVSTTV